MVKVCSAYGCTNNHNSNCSFFRFPKDPQLRKAWILQVKRTRDKWKGPSANSSVCSKHFTEDCFKPMSVLSKKMGLKRKQLLQPNAIPTIFKRPDGVPKKLRSSSAVEKLSRARLVAELLKSSASSGGDVSSKPVSSGSGGTGDGVQGASSPGSGVPDATSARLPGEDVGTSSDAITSASGKNAAQDTRSAQSGSSSSSDTISGPVIGGGSDGERVQEPRSTVLGEDPGQSSAPDNTSQDVGARVLAENSGTVGGDTASSDAGVMVLSEENSGTVSGGTASSVTSDIGAKLLPKVSRQRRVNNRTSEPAQRSGVDNGRFENASTRVRTRVRTRAATLRPAAQLLVDNSGPSSDHIPTSDPVLNWSAIDARRHNRLHSVGIQVFPLDHVQVRRSTKTQAVQTDAVKCCDAEIQCDTLPWRTSEPYD